MRKIDLSLVEQYTMPSGIGNLAENKISLVAQANLIDCLEKGLPIEALSDSLECACPVLRVLAIGLNDTKWWVNDQERTETLRPLISLLLDSRREPKVTAQRAQKAADFAKYAAKHAEYAAYAAKQTQHAAKYAAEYAAKHAAYAVKHAEYAAKHAESAAYAAKQTQHAAYAAKHAEYAAYAAGSAAKYAAESAAYAAKSLRPLRDELLKIWLECEVLQ